MTELYLIRHGESQMNTQNHLIGGRSNETPLTEEGVDQATRLGKYFLAQEIVPSRVYASPAVRTIQTATATLAAMHEDIPLIIADEIQEMDQGEYVGRLRTEVYTPDVLKQIEIKGKDFALTGGESMNDVGHRMLEWVQSTIQQDNGTIFVFGHGLAIRSLVSLRERWTRKETFEAVAENTSVTKFVAHSDDMNFEYFANTPHLIDS